jgi:hypothetical protein
LFGLRKDGRVKTARGKGKGMVRKRVRKKSRLRVKKSVR